MTVSVGDDRVKRKDPPKSSSVDHGVPQSRLPVRRVVFDLTTQPPGLPVTP